MDTKKSYKIRDHAVGSITVLVKPTKTKNGLYELEFDGDYFVESKQSWAIPPKVVETIREWYMHSGLSQANAVYDIDQGIIYMVRSSNWFVFLREDKTPEYTKSESTVLLEKIRERQRERKEKEETERTRASFNSVNARFYYNKAFDGDVCIETRYHGDFIMPASDMLAFVLHIITEKIKNDSH